MDKTKQILALIKPFVAQGKILPRGYQQIKSEEFIVLYDGQKPVACGGLRDCKIDCIAEIYAICVHQQYQHQGWAKRLLSELLKQAREAGFGRVFALSKYNSDWFFKQGFSKATLVDLPFARQQEFNKVRNSLIFFKNVN